MTGPARPPSPPAPPAAPRTGPQAGPRPEEAQAEPVIELVGVHKTLGGAEVLRGLDLQLFPRETLVIIGRSGSGKSVTLKHIVGLLQPDRGLVRVFGQELSKIGKRDLHAIRLRTGYLFQSGALINWLTIEENVALPLHEHRSDLPEKEVLARVRQKLEMVELGNAGNRYPSEVSGGMKKRAGLARATVLDPQVILYDEPTAGLDPVMSSTINELVIHTREVLGVSQVVVTHDMESAFRIADRIAMLYQGRIIASGSPEEIRRSEDPVVRQFITGGARGPITEGSPE